MHELKMTFEELPIGAVAMFGKNMFVKLAAPKSRVPLDKQPPDALLLDTNHYVVIGSRAVCVVVKTLQDLKYQPDENSDLWRDCDD